jgi:hypothetical protein
MQPPPLPPPCDLECQKQKKLVTLKRDLDSRDPIKDPEGYERARIAYYTLLRGQGWLAQEKSRVAKEEVEPVLSSYRQRFDSLKGEQQVHSTFKTLADAQKVQEQIDEEDGNTLKKYLQTEKDKAQVADRSAQLGGIPSSYWGWIIDIIIALLGILVVYKGYTRFFGQITVTTTPDLTSTI